MRSLPIGRLLFATVALTACHSMTPLSWSEVAGLRPSRVWVTHADQSVAEVSGPQVFGDTLVGYVNGGFVELPTAAIKQVVMRRPARGKTMALVAASIAGAAAVAVVVSSIGAPDAKDGVNCDDYDPGEHPLCP